MTGIFCLYKPEDMTSFTAVRRVRGITGEKKCGHCGTLDPMATGVLPVMMGGATRFLDFLPTSPKHYRAALRLGLKTDTLDRTGKVLSTCPVTVGRAELEELLPTFRGEILQVPPMYSALKQNGIRLYDLARQGKEVEREARPVSVYSLTLLPDGTDGTSSENGEYVLDVSCSGGTYIRTLIDDLGEALGCGAVMTALERLGVGPLTKEQAVTLEELEQARDEGRLADLLIPLETALSDYPSVSVTEAQATRFQNGGGLSLERLKGVSGHSDSTLLRVLDPEECFLGLGEISREEETLRVKRVYINR